MRLARCSSAPTGLLQVLCLGADAPAGARAFHALAADDAARARAAARTSQSLAISADDIATICWTSGTEGMPKGVPRSHNHWIAISGRTSRGAGIQRGERLLNPFPLINMAAIGGCFMSWLHSAGTLILHHPLDLPVYLQQIATERPHYAIAPPAILNMLLKDEKLLAGVDLSSLRCIGSGSAPLDPGHDPRLPRPLRHRGRQHLRLERRRLAAQQRRQRPDPAHRARLFPRWGRAEINGRTPPPLEDPTRLVDPASGEEVSRPASPAKCRSRGPTVFDGYFRAPDVTAQSFTADGWFRTGDLFQLDGEPGDLRFYRFVGRLSRSSSAAA